MKPLQFFKLMTALGKVFKKPIVYRLLQSNTQLDQQSGEDLTGFGIAIVTP